MVFSNLLFIYLFLPLNLIFYTFAKDIRSKNRILLIFSLIFYAWGEPKYVLLLVFMSLVDWALALGIEKSRGTFKAKLFLILAVAVNLSLIGVFKYTPFFAGITQKLFKFPEAIPAIALPIGISFYTFQLLSYVIDVYRGDCEAQPNYSRVLLYASLFHQCIAGPIVRYKDINEQILGRTTDFLQVSRGISRFAVGLGKKVLLANVCGSVCDMFLLSDSAIGNEAMFVQNVKTLSQRPALALWAGMFFFMLQIYIDFSAYSDMAIGMGLMVGFKYKENFSYPYTSKSVTEFWRRWHISLGTFFRDYVYIPLGGNRKGLPRQIFNMCVVWILTGLWHGASWNFVFWGVYFLIFLIFEKTFLLKKMEKWPSVVSRIYLLAVVYFGWVLFKFTHMTMVITVLKGMFGLNGNGFTSFEVSAGVKNYLIFAVVAILSVTPLVRNIGVMLTKQGRRNFILGSVNSVIRIASPAVLLILSTFALVGDSYNPFLYFQF